MPVTPKLFVTGASGQLGRLVIDTLLETTPASAIVAGMRDPAKAEGNALREKGVEVRAADYSRPETLASAFSGVDRLLLISGSENGKRKEQHRNVIDAAKAAGVGLIAYTSILHADTTPLFLAEEHRDTEAALAEAGVPFVPSAERLVHGGLYVAAAAGLEAWRPQGRGRRGTHLLRGARRLCEGCGNCVGRRRPRRAHL